MTGPEALSAYLRANALCKEGKYDEAAAVPMLPSDAKLIAEKIAAARLVNCANTTKERT